MSLALLKRKDLDRGHPFWNGELNHFFDDVFKDFFPVSSRETSVDAFSPKIDLRESSEKLQVFVELPGLEPKDIDVSIDGDALTIRGERRLESESEDKSDQWYFERSFGSFSRTIPLPAEVNQEKVSATYKNGILTIDLPRTEAAQSKVRKIKVK